MPSLLKPDGTPLSREAPAFRPAPLRSHSDPVSERIVDFNGGFRIVTEQKCDETIKAVHEAVDYFPGRSKADGVRFAASVPVVQALIWAKECGAAVGTRPWILYAEKKLKTDFKKLRVQR